MSRRVSAVEEVRSHVKVLREMLGVYRRPGQAPPDQAALQVGPRGLRGCKGHVCKAHCKCFHTYPSSPPSSRSGQ